MGFSNHNDSNMADSFNSKKLRPRIPMSAITATTSTSTTTISSPYSTETQGSDFFSLQDHLGLSTSSFYGYKLPTWFWLINKFHLIYKTYVAPQVPQNQASASWMINLWVAGGVQRLNSSRSLKICFNVGLTPRAPSRSGTLLLNFDGSVRLRGRMFSIGSRTTRRGSGRSAGVKLRQLHSWVSAMWRFWRGKIQVLFQNCFC